MGHINEIQTTKETIPHNDIERQDPSHVSKHKTRLSESLTLDTDQSTVYLDGLRGIAALCVFNQHLIGGGDHERGFGEEGYYYFISLPFVRVFYNGGGAAVSVFFVLSGLVLSQRPVKSFRAGQRKECVNNLISAAIRRPIRLYLPALAITFILAMAMHLPNNVYPGMAWSPPQETISSEIVQVVIRSLKFFNPFQHHGSDQPGFYYDIVMWTLPIELKFSMLIYTLTPIWCFGFGARPWSIGLLLVSVMISLQLGSYMVACFVAGLALTMIDLYNIDTTYVLSRMCPRTQKMFVHGILIMGWYLMSQPAVGGKREWSLDAPGWGLLTTFTPGAYNSEGYYRFWQSYGAILVVYSTLRLRWLQNLFLSRPLRYLGKVSFMLYLLHLPLFIGVIDQLIRIYGHISLGSPQRWHDNLLRIPDVGPKGFSTQWIFSWLTALAVCLGISDLATTFIDRPCMKLGHKLSQRIGLGSAAKHGRSGSYSERVSVKADLHNAEHTLKQ